MRINRTSIAVMSLLGGIVLSQSFAGSASAEDIPIEIHFNDPTSQTIEYGEYWAFQLTADYSYGDYIYGQDGATATVAGAPSGYQPDFLVYDQWPYAYGYVAAGYEMAALGVGAYSITVQGEVDYAGAHWHGNTDPPASLTITKAPLGIEFRVVPDPLNADAVIATARFTGRFVEEYQSSFFPSAGRSPEGTWHITIEDAEGNVAIERSIERSAGDDVLATSFYWADAEPDMEYTASAEFVVSGPSASNFTIGTAPDFSFTGLAETRPVPTSTATGTPNEGLPEPAGFGLPLWSLCLAGALVIGLGALVTVLSVRLTRRPNGPEKAVNA